MQCRADTVPSLPADAAPALRREPRLLHRFVLTEKWILVPDPVRRRSLLCLPILKPLLLISLVSFSQVGPVLLPVGL